MHDHKVALITGANKGIGLEIARQLGNQGITVLIGARDYNRGREAAQKLQAENLDARAVQLDVTDQSTIDAAAQHIEKEFGFLDILVNNAGIAIDDAPPSQLDIEALRRTYDTNVFGVFAVTKAMLPLLKKSQAGRIVNMSSGLGSLAQNSDPNYIYADHKYLAYNSSKTALNAMTVQFAHELRDTPIKVNSADPGYVATDINALLRRAFGTTGRNRTSAFGNTAGRRADRWIFRRKRRRVLVKHSLSRHFIGFVEYSNRNIACNGDRSLCENGLTGTRVGIRNSGSVKISQTTFAAIV